MLAFEALLLPNNSLQILRPLHSFTRPRRVIVTVLDEEGEEVAIQNGVQETANVTIHPTLQAEPQEEHGWSPHSKRIPNLHAGLIQMSDDFDDPLPDSFVR